MKKDEFDLDIMEITDDEVTEDASDKQDVKKSSGGKLVKALLLLVVLAAIVCGAFYLIKNRGCTVTYDTQGGNEVIVDSNRRYEKGEKLDAVQNPYREGYLFTGWYTDPSCEDAYLWDMNSDTIQDDMTLYAGWIGMISEEEMEQPVSGSPLINP